MPTVVWLGLQKHLAHARGRPVWGCVLACFVHMCLPADKVHFPAQHWHRQPNGVGDGVECNTEVNSTKQKKQNGEVVHHIRDEEDEC